MTRQYEGKGREGTLQPFHECCDILKLKPCVITISHTLRSDRNYSKSIVSIMKFSDKFSITDSGISRPKIVECQGSDGLLYRQLVKGGEVYLLFTSVSGVII